jgi:tRNA (cmo5U34)-methyltransferase
VKHDCNYPGCTTQVGEQFWGCSLHWYAIPFYLRKELKEFYRPNNENAPRLYLNFLRTQAKIEQYVLDQTKDITMARPAKKGTPDPSYVEAMSPYNTDGTRRVPIPEHVPSAAVAARVAQADLPKSAKIRNMRSRVAIDCTAVDGKCDSKCLLECGHSVDHHKAIDKAMGELAARTLASPPERSEQPRAGAFEHCLGFPRVDSIYGGEPPAKVLTFANGTPISFTTPHILAPENTMRITLKDAEARLQEDLAARVDISNERRAGDSPMRPKRPKQKSQDTLIDRHIAAVEQAKVEAAAPAAEPDFLATVVSAGTTGAKLLGELLSMADRGEIKPLQSIDKIEAIVRPTEATGTTLPEEEDVAHADPLYATPVLLQQKVEVIRHPVETDVPEELAHEERAAYQSPFDLPKPAFPELGIITATHAHAIDMGMMIHDVRLEIAVEDQMHAALTGGEHNDDVPMVEELNPRAAAILSGEGDTLPDEVVLPFLYPDGFDAVPPVAEDHPLRMNGLPGPELDLTSRDQQEDLICAIKELTQELRMHGASFTTCIEGETPLSPDEILIGVDELARRSNGIISMRDDEGRLAAPASVDAMAHHVQSIAAQDTRKMDIPADWTFHNKSVADNFDSHVREQLPWYDIATGVVSHFGRHYLPEGGRMYDIGASTGNVTLMLKNEIEKRGVEAISLDNSQAMADVWRGIGKFEVADIRTYPLQSYDYAVCFLLLMFLPPADQRKVVQDLYHKLNPGGALLIFDKTDKFSGYLATVVHRLTMAGKVATGVPADEIVKKELSLAGAQRPIDVDRLLFRDMGATEVFRFGEFAGWVITK